MSQRRAPAWLTEWEYAHRGLHGEGVPENSLTAAEAAIAAGMGIECDVQMSRDGVPIVFHDWDFERLVGANGRFSERTAGEICAMSLKGSDQSPVRLEQFLTFVDARAPLLIEVKSNGAMDLKAVCGSIIDALSGYSGPHAIMSFDHWIVEWLGENAPQAPRGLVMREDEYGNTQTFEEREFALGNARPEFLAYDIAALPNPWVADLRREGLPILTWTVNSPETRVSALKNADGLISEGEGIA